MAITISESAERYGYDFISGEYIPDGKDEYYLRNIQAGALYPDGEQRLERWRHLTAAEILALERNGNTCPNWYDVLVMDQFNSDSIRNTFFAGLVRIGDIGSGLLRYHDYSLPEGITNSRIISCDIGNHCAVHDCRYLSHYIIGNRVILSSINEMDTTNHSKFGTGIVKDGEDEDVRIWIAPLNEAGGREVLPFYDMICADAYLWAIYREDRKLMDAFLRITQNSYDSRRGFYGIIGHETVIKHCLTIKDVQVGNGAYIKGANKLKNLSIKSDCREPTQIGEGVELVNGIIGYGCRVFYGCKAIRFVLGNNCSLKYGARLIHSILGDNSTISCCEVLNNLVFPTHEQHHNNSFLIAAMIMGQSNMAAGATIGSNHNSRGNDGEIIAGRGFWPGLSSTLKHNCRFASFCLITKGNYSGELHIPLPFSLVTDNTMRGRLEVMPAYWWMYNMYALERNNWKFRTRDKRVFVEQHIETAYLAPDTAAEILKAMELLEEWTGRAALLDKTTYIDADKSELCSRGRRLLLEFPETVSTLTICGEGMERSNRCVKLIKAEKGYASYRQMLQYYAVRTIAEYLSAERAAGRHTDIAAFQQVHPGRGPLDWVNLGGQLVPAEKVDALRTSIREGDISGWAGVHARYEQFWAEYPLDRTLNALEVLRFITDADEISGTQWNSLLDSTAEIRRFVEEQVYATKMKDYASPFREITYRNRAERDAVLGKVKDTPLFRIAKEETAEVLSLFDSVRMR